MSFRSLTTNPESVLTWALGTAPASNSAVSVHLDDLGRCSRKPHNGCQVQWGSGVVSTSHITVFFQYLKLLLHTRIFSTPEPPFSGYHENEELSRKLESSRYQPSLLPGRHKSKSLF